jgi:hypothetical protein
MIDAKRIEVVDSNLAVPEPVVVHKVAEAPNGKAHRVGAPLGDLTRAGGAVGLAVGGDASQRGDDSSCLQVVERRRSVPNNWL